MAIFARRLFVSVGKKFADNAGIRIAQHHGAASISDEFVAPLDHAMLFAGSSDHDLAGRRLS